MSEGFEEVDVLRDAMAERIRVKATRGQADKEGRVESEDRVVSELDPEPLRYSSVHNRPP